MNLTWKDALSAVIAVLAAIVVYARAQAYSWFFVDGWRRAVAVLGVLGVIMLALNVADLLETNNWRSWGEAVLWAGFAALIIIGLFMVSSAVFYVAALVLGLVWLALTIRHFLEADRYGRPFPNGV